MGTTSLEDVAAASEGSPLLIFQLYVQRDRDFTASLIRSKFSIFVVSMQHRRNAAQVNAAEGSRVWHLALLTPC